MNQIEISIDDGNVGDICSGIVWNSRNDCVLDCVATWLAVDRAGWQLIAKVAQAKAQFGATILHEIAEMRHQSVHTLQNWLSTWNSPVREKAIELELSPGHVDAIAGIAATDEEQAEDYLQTAAEKGLSVVALRRHVASSGSTERFPTTGTIPPAVKADEALNLVTSYQETVTGVWIHNSMKPEQVWDELTRIFDEEWTVRFYKLVTTGEIE